MKKGRFYSNMVIIITIFTMIASFGLAAESKGSFDYSARYYSFIVVNQLKVVKMKITYSKGQKINGLEFIEDLGGRPRKAKFKCKCGKIFKTRIDSVKGGQTKSCKCLMKVKSEPTGSVLATSVDSTSGVGTAGGGVAATVGVGSGSGSGGRSIVATDSEKVSGASRAPANAANEITTTTAPPSAYRANLIGPSPALCRSVGLRLTSRERTRGYESRNTNAT